MKYFRNFPLIEYSEQGTYYHVMRNVMVSGKVADQVLERFDVYYPYNIEDGERADTIAADYYGDSDFAWLIYLANNIVDPYYQWPLVYRDMLGYIVKKYGSIPEAKAEIRHYAYTGIGGDTQDEIDRKSWFMSPETYSYLSAEEKSGWTPVYAYDYEIELNDERRTIILLDNVYIPQIKKEFSVLFDDN